MEILQSSLNSNKIFEERNKCKNKPEEINDNIAEGVKVRSKISWYEEGGKGSIFLKTKKKQKRFMASLRNLK